MTQEESKVVRVGDILRYLGRDVKVDEIQVMGSEYHPYFKLIPEDDVSISLFTKITKGYVSYVLCDLIQEDSK